MIRFRWRQHLRLLYSIFIINLLFFFLIYHRLVLISYPRFHISIATIIDDEQFPSSSICHIPRFDPWDQTLAKSLRIKPVYRCPTTKRRLIDRYNGTQLFINQFVNRTSYAGRITHCLSTKIVRNPEEKFFRDWSYSLSPIVLMNENLTEPIVDADFVLVRCYTDRRGFFEGGKFCDPLPCPSTSKMNATEQKLLSNVLNQSLVYEYVHPLIRRKKPALTSEPPSVLLIILDAVSHLQAQRALPRTLAYLKSKGLQIFEKHTVVGDGTFANLVPMLFGRPSEDLEILNVNDSRYAFETIEYEVDSKTKKKVAKKSFIYYPGPFDNSSFIAQNFSRVNYTTFFSEEWRESAFYNLKNGFRQAPTDFYLRPYWLSLYQTSSYPFNPGNSNDKPCYLDELLHRLSLNWLRDFLEIHRPRRSYPTFGILKINEMSHDYLERLFWIDDDLKSYFQNLIEDQLLDNTILIFAGDHGHRQHQIRLTRIGSFEVKLPFLSILFPDQWKTEYPQAMKNLQANQQKLTSWWDVYETLANVLRMAERSDRPGPLQVQWKATTPGISLFHPIPERNCSTAGIPEKFCPCTRSKPADVNTTLIKELALATVDHINQVKLANRSHLCASLALKTLIRAEEEEIFANDQTFNLSLSTKSALIYTILFEVAPSGGIFESRLLYDPKSKKVHIHQDILRINLYGQSSQCIQDNYHLRSFCYCLSYGKNSTNTTKRTR